MNKIANILLKLASELDELGFSSKAQEIDEIVEAMLEVQPSAQPMIQKDPITPNPKEAEEKQPDAFSWKKPEKKKGVSKGTDYITTTK